VGVAGDAARLGRGTDRPARRQVHRGGSRSGSPRSAAPQALARGTAPLPRIGRGTSRAIRPARPATRRSNPISATGAALPAGGRDRSPHGPDPATARWDRDARPTARPAQGPAEAGGTARAGATRDRRCRSRVRAPISAAENSEHISNHGRNAVRCAVEQKTSRRRTNRRPLILYIICNLKKRREINLR